MQLNKNDLVNGKESLAGEAKRLFMSIDFGSLKKSEFVAIMLNDVVAPANEVHAMVKHLEAVWRGKAAPTMAELKKAQSISVQSSPTSKTVKSLERMNIVSAYQPKYDTTKKLQEKFKKASK